MAATTGRHLLLFTLCALAYDLALSQTTTSTTTISDVKYKSDLSNDTNSNGSAESGSKGGNSSSNVGIASNVGISSNVGIASTSNCSCTRDLAALKRDMREETNQRLALKAALDSYVAELSELRNLVPGNSSKPTATLNAPAALSPSVAFSAKLSYNRELKPLDTVIFDTVLTNDGNAYDLDTGKFTAIVTGTYMFHSTILSGYNTKVETAIIVNDKEIARIYSGAHDAHGSGSNMAIVNLRTGDSVWVRLLYQGGNHVHGYYSTFTGALLRSSDI